MSWIGLPIALRMARGGAAPPAGPSRLLTEGGDALLLEDGSVLLTE